LANSSFKPNKYTENEAFSVYSVSQIWTSTPTKMTLEQAQNQVDAWINEYGVRYFNELTNMAILTEEVGEVARIISRKYGEQSEKEADKNKDLGDEMADVLWVLLCLANQCDINLTEAFAANITKKTNRDSERHIQNEKLK